MNKKISIILIFLVLNFGFVGCQDIFDTFKGTSTTGNTEQTVSITRAQKIQTIYWLCVENSTQIEVLRSSWETKYGKDIVDEGVKLYDSIIVEQASTAAGIDCSHFTDKQKAELRDLIIKIQGQK